MIVQNDCNNSPIQMKYVRANCILNNQINNITPIRAKNFNDEEKVSNYFSTSNFQSKISNSPILMNSQKINTKRSLSPIPKENFFKEKI